MFFGSKYILIKSSIKEFLSSALVVLTFSSCAMARDMVEVSKAELTETIKLRAREKDKTAFATVGVIQQLELKNNANSKVDVVWSALSDYEILHLHSDKLKK